ncbi:hypothetical protein ACLOJK_035602 [Asimina triloba]
MPMMGRAADVRSRTSWSWPNIFPQMELTATAKVMERTPKKDDAESATIMTLLALCGMFAPSSLLILVDTPKLMEDGRIKTAWDGQAQQGLPPSEEFQRNINLTQISIRRPVGCPPKAQIQKQEEDQVVIRPN